MCPIALHHEGLLPQFHFQRIDKSQVRFLSPQSAYSPTSEHHNSLVLSNQVLEIPSLAFSPQPPWSEVLATNLFSNQALQACSLLELENVKTKNQMQDQAILPNRNLKATGFGKRYEVCSQKC
jgi:hypothetical protein